MIKSRNIILFFSVLALGGLAFISYKLYIKQTHLSGASESIDYVANTNESVNQFVTFSDGLPRTPDAKTQYPLADDMPGIEQKLVYYIDINQDGQIDKISKMFFNNRNAHSYYAYKIELLNNNEYIDITPKDLRTVNGADCDIQQIQFSFEPDFNIKIIHRDLGDGWNEPTTATQDIFKLSNNTMKLISTQKLQSVCDVKKLF